MKRIWTVDEDEYLIRHFADEQTIDIAKALKRTYASVSGRAHLKGLKKSETFFADQVKSGRINIEGGEKTRFKKGNEPWNKGKKGIDIGGKETRFKKGNKPTNTKHDGCISVRADSSGKMYQYIRVSKAKWVLLHRYIWEKENGPIPPGMIVVFKDKNYMNCKLKNLECISKQENMIRNTIHRYPEELKDTIRILTKIKKQINNGKEQTNRP